MGEWKAQISIRVRQELRREMEEFAYKERRKLGNLGELLLEWAWEQLQIVGSSERLMKFRVPVSAQRPGSQPRRKPCSMSA